MNFPSDSGIVIGMENIQKCFGNFIAVQDVSLEVQPGEVHALLGENGAGKTTLMNVLSGLFPPDRGMITINHKAARFHSPRDAAQAGIGMVHQEFMLVPTLTVAENIFLGRKDTLLRKSSRMKEEIVRLSEESGLAVDPDARVDTLPMGIRQRIEILRALSLGAKVLLLDEPTSVLTPKDTDHLFQSIRKLQKSGCGFVFISHKLHEVLEISDRITVMRQGSVVYRINTAEATRSELAVAMVGREIFPSKKLLCMRGGELLRFDHVSLTDGERIRLRDLSFNVHAGEIVGLAGVANNGQDAIEDILMGFAQPRGKIFIAGKECGEFTPNQWITHRVVCIPENRKGKALVMGLTILENLQLKRIHRSPFAQWGWIDWKKVRDHALKLITAYNIQPPQPDRAVETLSGGNQQKVAISQAVAIDPLILVAVNPTQGLDVGATEFVHQTLMDLRNQQKGVLLISTDLDEIINISDRVYVLYEGRATEAPSLRRETIGNLMGGGLLS